VPQEAKVFPEDDDRTAGAKRNAESDEKEESKPVKEDETPENIPGKEFGEQSVDPDKLPTGQGREVNTPEKLRNREFKQQQQE
jgi:hypothetical protein